MVETKNTKMTNSNKILIIRQLDKKLESYDTISKYEPPQDGWLKTIRKSLNMSLLQLGSRLSMSPQGLRDLENREINGTLTMNTLEDAGNALGLKLVYGFIPIEDSLEQMIERKSLEMAEKIVKRTSTTMKLEDQENTQLRLKQAVKELAEDIKREIPKSLWD